MYKVERIVDKKLGQAANEQMYLVKWANYDISYSSWQNLKTLSQNCLDMVQQFQRNQEKITTTIIGKVNPARNVVKSLQQQKAQGVQQQTKIPKKQRKIQKEQKVNLLKKRHYNRAKKQQSKTNNKQIQFDRNQLEVNKISKQKIGSLKQILQENEQKIDSIINFQPQIIRPMQTRKNSTIAQNMNINKENAKSEQLPKKGISIPKNIDKNQLLQNQTKISQKEVVPMKLSFTPIIIKDPQQYIMARKNSISQRNIESRQKKQPNRVYMGSNKQKKQKQEKQAIDIIGMKKKGSKYQFYVLTNCKKVWMTHDYLFQNYSKQLCRFYQKNMILE